MINHPGFDLARQLRSRQFRAYLALAGYCSGTTICALGANDPLPRPPFGSAEAGSALIARQDPAAPHGWALSWTGAAR